MTLFREACMHVQVEMLERKRGPEREKKRQSSICGSSSIANGVASLKQVGQWRFKVLKRVRRSGSAAICRPACGDSGAIFLLEHAGAGALPLFPDEDRAEAAGRGEVDDCRMKPLKRFTSSSCTGFRMKSSAPSALQLQGHDRRAQATVNTTNT